MRVPDRLKGKDTMKSPRSRRSVASLAALAVTAVLSSMSLFNPLASAAEGDTTRGYNGPEDCVAINGNVVAPGPGDCAQFGKEGQGRTDETARNVILIVGDGMGQQEITAARNYLKGAAGRFEGIDELTSEGQYTHHSVNRDGSINYVTDSAASGTAWATGTKTYNGGVGVQIDGTPVPNLIELAKLGGMRTGNVTTSEIQDATPAAMGAHALNRKCYGPENTEEANGRCFGEEYDAQYRENGGLGSISEQLIDTRADVTLGGGSAAFEQIVQEGGPGRNPYLTADEGHTQTEWTEGDSVLENAEANGFQVATDADELAAITEADQDEPVLGLFAEGNMATRFEPHLASVGGAHDEPVQCTPQDTGDEPDLSQMTDKAIELLDDPEAEKGFFLQIESASIDKSAHGSDICGQIGETERLDEVTKAALDFAKADGDTLVVVTADHSHSTQIVYDDADSVSATARLETADGTPMTVAYGTIPADEAGESSTQHTGAQLRVAAYGPGEENVLGQTDQTDLFYTMLSALDLNPDKSDGASDAGLAKPVAASNPAETCFRVDANGNMVAPLPGDCAQYGTEGEQRSDEQAKNMILFIGDGMGDSEITSARNYLYGANGRLPGVDALPYTGSYTHYALNPETGLPDYVTDSAASGTGWATGTKTYNGGIGIGLDGTPHANLLEMAKAAGMKTGNVTTSEIQDATPAVMGAHAVNRKCYGPENTEEANPRCTGGEFDAQYRENGGLGSISEQLIDTRADITLGGGSAAFDQTVQVSGEAGDTTWTEGDTVLENAEANGFQVVTNKAELEAATGSAEAEGISLRQADPEGPILGLFDEGNLPRNFLETVPTTDGAMQDPARCEKNPERTEDVPTLADMTSAALNVLPNEEGFFLQVEGASIDKADHASDICGQIGELDDLDQAVQVARDWVAESGEPTLIVVTADHAHTSQIVYNDAETAGLVTKLTTADGAPMSVNYATASDNEGASSTHTGAQLRIAAEGPSAENVIGFTDQTDLHFTVVNALGLDTDVEPGVPFTPAEEPGDDPTTPAPAPEDPESPAPQPEEPGDPAPEPEDPSDPAPAPGESGQPGEPGESDPDSDEEAGAPGPGERPGAPEGGKGPGGLPNTGAGDAAGVAMVVGVAAMLGLAATSVLRRRSRQR